MRLVVGLALASLAFPASAATRGDLWEVTSRRSVDGGEAVEPGRTVKVCAPKTWTEPPGAVDGRLACTSSEFATDGPKATWKVTCAGPPEMTGAGELTREGDAAWSGSIRFETDEGTTLVKLDGRKVGGCVIPTASPRDPRSASR